MGSYKRHIKVDHNGDLEHIRAARRDLRELRENRGDDLTVDDLAKFIDRHLSGMEGHKSMMSQEADSLYDEIRPQGHLVAPLVANQPFLDRPAGTGKAAGDLDRIRPDGVRGVLVPNAAVSEQFQKVFGSLDDDNLAASPANVIAVPRHGAPPLNQKPDVPLQFEHLIKVEDDL